MTNNSDDIRAIPSGHVLSDYKFEKVLGQGSFGITYLATDTMLNRKVAIKEYFPREFAARDSTLTVKAAGNKDDRDNFVWGLKRFLDEARILAIFDHPNIIQVRRFFEANGTAYLVMDYCDGTPLDELLKSSGVLPPARLESLISSLLNALEIIHRTNFLHRDIKPANIFIKNDGTPVLLDFGAARQELVSHSKSVTAIATPGYAAFEQYSSHGNQGPWTDIYGLGATLYRAVTGKKPDDATNRMLEDTLTPCQKLCSDNYSVNLLKAIDAAMAVKPQDRPQTISDWRKMFSFLESTKHTEELKINKNISNVSPNESILIHVNADLADSSQVTVNESTNSRNKKKYLVGGLSLISVIGITSYLIFSGGDSQVSNSSNDVTPIAVTNTTKKSVDTTQTPVKDKPLPEKKLISPQKSECPKGSSISSWTNCNGSHTYASGATYTGDWVSGKRSGQGVGVSNDGAKYVGEWLNDRFHGIGTLSFSSGDFYKGQFSDGFFNGKGIYTWKSGDKYDGQYVNGYANGQGTYYFKDGRKYVGSFVNSKFDGQGSMLDQNGRVIFSGLWANGQAKDNSNDPSSKETNMAKCREAATNAKKGISLPRKVDNITSIVDMFCAPGVGGKATFVYKYEVDSQNNFDQSTLNQYVRESNRKLVCAPDLKIYMPIVDFEYQYFYSKLSSNYSPGALIGKLRYTQSDCN